MSVTLELGFSLGNDIEKMEVRNYYLDRLGKLKGNIDMSEEEIKANSINIEAIHKHP